ncbi:Noc2-domain-containing protein [Rickenella mellea]|uniref:Noc2-domain-containing protein n=1 Tax=Rickenella mellea TaxID=50990 RepID=A0A4Y7QJB9_9AGAM|nr:Noc2-domain-containing protein [Rickenella mellea]
MGGSEDDEDVDMGDAANKKFKGMSVDDFLGGGFMSGESDEEAMSEAGDDDDSGSEGEASFASVDDLEDEGVAHKLELAKLAEKDPEFYKYLQENDKELLDFNLPDVGMDEDDEDGDDDDDDVKVPVLTTELLKRWQKAMLEHRSLRALRRLLIAFRSAAHMNDDEHASVWTIDNASVYDKLITTALRYTPIVLEHHVPYKTLPDGKFKPPTQTPKQKILQKLTLSFFYNIIHLLEQFSEHDMILLAVNESAKLVPYIVGVRKAVKLYLKTLLRLWSSAEDDIRIAAFLAMRKLTSSSDESIKDMVFKGAYLTLVRSAKSTSAHTLPGINFMKNSASELFTTDHATAYQHAFAYIRQLAVHLRNSMKVKSKEAYKQVYNWQYAHCVDFWSIVLARACHYEAEIENGGLESDLKPLIYPLSQVTLGAIKLISNSRSYPFHLSLIRSLVHLQKHTRTYIPLIPYIMPIITATLSPSARPKPSTLRPLDLETNIRAPAQYIRTRVYSEGLLEEATYILAEWLGTRQVQGSIAFPEIVVPLTVTLKKGVKHASGGKEAGVVKGLLERIDEGVKWVEQRRKGVTFRPKNVQQVDEWERSVNLEETPIGKYIKTQRKIREKRRKLVEKARDGEDEILEDD